MKKYRINMIPRAVDELFWNERGQIIGGCNDIFVEDIDVKIMLDPLDVEGLEEWFREFNSLYNFETAWTQKQLKDWQNRGLELAKLVKEKLPENVDLYYYFINTPVWARDDDKEYKDKRPRRIK